MYALSLKIKANFQRDDLECQRSTGKAQAGILLKPFWNN